MGTITLAPASAPQTFPARSGSPGRVGSRRSWPRMVASYVFTLWVVVTLVFALLAGARTLERSVLDASAGGAAPAATSAAATGGSSPSASALGPAGPGGPSHVVQPGDTVWSIAERLRPVHVGRALGAEREVLDARERRFGAALDAKGAGAARLVDEPSECEERLVRQHGFARTRTWALPELVRHAQFRAAPAALYLHGR